MKYFLSICAAMAILGCGTNGDYKAQDGGTPSVDTGKTDGEKTDGGKTDGGKTDGEKTDEQTYKDKGGLSGIVYAQSAARAKSYSKVCFDVNTNGVCDNGEASETVYEGGKFSFEKSVSDANKGNVLLSVAKKSEEGARGYLTSYTNNVTPYTTLVVNEVLYNPNANANVDTAKTLLSAKFNVDLLNGKIESDDDISKLYTTFQSSIEKGGNVYNSIANAVNAIYKQDSLSPNVTISEQKRASAMSGTKLTLNATDKSVTWDKTDGDETYMGSYSKSNKAISYSRWHNALRVVDLKNESLIQSKKFLYIDGDRYAVDSSTGASEQILKKVVQDDSGNVYALMKKYGDKTADKVGVYKINIANGIPDVKYASAANSDNFYALQDGNDMAISKNILVVGSANSLTMFNSSDSASLAKPYAEKGNINVKTVSASKGFIFAGVSKRKANKLVVYDDALNEIESINTNELTSSVASSIYPNQIVSYENMFYFSLKDDDLGNKVYVYKVDGTSLKQVKQLSTMGQVNKLHVSSDGKILTVTTWDKKLIAYETDTFSSTSADISEIGYGGYVHDDKIALAYKNSFSFYNLKKEKSSLSEADKQAWTNEYRK